MLLSVDKFIIKNTRKQYQMLSSLRQNKNLNQRYNHQLGIFQKFSNFCCKIEIFVPFHSYFASNITLVLRFKISNKYYFYSQTANVNSKDVSWSNFVHDKSVQIKSLLVKSEDQLRIGSCLMFSTVLASLALFWFCFLCVYFGHTHFFI